MPDRARVWTDKRLEIMEKHLTTVYTQAQEEIGEKWEAYMQRAEKRLENLYNAYLSAPPDKKQEILQKYQAALQNATLKNKWYRDMIDETTLRLANVNKIASDYINDQIPAIYATNYNYIDPELKSVGIKWTLRDEYTVRNMMRDTLPLPQRTLNYAKDMLWNRRQINSALLQGILQGESIPKMAKRLYPIVGNNKVSAIRTARTMVTGAENRGRLDRYHDYEDKGVVMSKVWIATPDNRVRNWHLSMDGQEVPVDESFIDGLGNELEYPGDPSAPGNTVYNCRCSMRSHIIGMRQSDGTIKRIRYEGDTPTMHGRQIAEERARREEEQEDFYD